MGELEPIALEPVEALAITTLVDNTTDILLVDDGPARRPPLGSGPRVAAAALEGGEAFDALRAEHGFAALVTFTARDREHRLLFDTGISPDGLVENMRRLEVSPRDVEAIVPKPRPLRPRRRNGRAYQRARDGRPAGVPSPRGLGPEKDRATRTRASAARFPEPARA